MNEKTKQAFLKAVAEIYEAREKAFAEHIHHWASRIENHKSKIEQEKKEILKIEKHLESLKIEDMVHEEFFSEHTAGLGPNDPRFGKEFAARGWRFVK